MPSKEKVNTFTKIIVLCLIIINLLIAKSICFISFFSILFLILHMITNKSVKSYKKIIKNIWPILLFAFIVYIIIRENILISFVFTYKILLIMLYIEMFCLTVSFQNFTNGINTLLKSLNRIISTEQISLNISTFLYFSKMYLNSKNNIINYYKDKKLYNKFNLKYFIFPRLYFAIDQTKKMESSLKLKFYKPIIEKNNFKSIVILSLSILLTIIAIFKEVIL